VFYQRMYVYTDVPECGVIAVKIAPFCERESILREALRAASSSGSQK
jgi:hypothetical protein